MAMRKNQKKYANEARQYANEAKQYYFAVVSGSAILGIGFNLAVVSASGNLSGADGVDCILSSFSPLRTFSISSLVSVSYSMSALVRISNSLRFSVRILIARERPSSTRRLISASISCLVSDDSLS